MLFNEKLKMLRKGKDLTQEDLAERLNVSRQAITKWESGEGVPDIENLKQISIYFDVSIDELVKENLTIINSEKYSYSEVLDIEHSKHFDIVISKVFELNILSNNEEKMKIEILSSEEENLKDSFKVKIDDLYNKIYININSKKEIKDAVINIYLPEKYIDEIELKSKIKVLNISNLNIEKIEYDGELKYLNVNNSKGKIVLNTSKCDIEAEYDKLDGELEVNTINSTARVKIPKEAEYRAVLKGIKNSFVDENNTENSKNKIELNGVNSKLIIIKK